MTKLAAVAYSKYPYNEKLPTLKEKMQYLIHVLGFTQWKQTLKKLERLGRNCLNKFITYYYNISSIVNKNISSSSSSSPTLHTKDNLNNSSKKKRNKSPSNKNTKVKNISRTEATSQNQQSETRLEMPEEKDLDIILKEIFSHYIAFGNKAGYTHIGKMKYRRFIKEINLLDETFTSADADLVFSEVTQNGSKLMKYPIFCNSLALLATKKFPLLKPHEALRKLLIDHVLIFAKKNKIQETVFHHEPLSGMNTL